MLAIVKFIVVMATAGLLLAEDLDLDLSELADELENLEKRVPHIHYGDSSENKNHGAKRVPPSDAGEDGSENKSDGATRVAQFNFGEDSSENKHDGAKRVPHVHYGDSTENKNHGAKRLLVRLLSRALLELDEK